MYVWTYVGGHIYVWTYTAVDIHTYGHIHVWTHIWHVDIQMCEHKNTCGTYISGMGLRVDHKNERYCIPKLVACHIYYVPWNPWPRLAHIESNNRNMLFYWLSFSHQNWHFVYIYIYVCVCMCVISSYTSIYLTLQILSVRSTIAIFHSPFFLWHSHIVHNWWYW